MYIFYFLTLYILSLASMLKIIYLKTYVHVQGQRFTKYFYSNSGAIYVQ